MQVNTGIHFNLAKQFVSAAKGCGWGEPSGPAPAPCQLLGEQGKGQACLLANSAVTLLLLQPHMIC